MSESNGTGGLLFTVTSDNFRDIYPAAIEEIGRILAELENGLKIVDNGEQHPGIFAHTAILTTVRAIINTNQELRRTLKLFHEYASPAEMTIIKPTENRKAAPPEELKAKKGQGVK